MKNQAVTKSGRHSSLLKIGSSKPGLPTVAPSARSGRQPVAAALGTWPSCKTVVTVNTIKPKGDSILDTRNRELKGSTRNYACHRAG